MKKFYKWLLVLVLAVMPVALAAPASEIPLKEITTRPLENSDEAFFKQNFLESFLDNYKSKVFLINQDQKPTLLGATHIGEKKTWLAETADEEFQDYVTQPKPGYKGVVIEHKGKPVGAALYRLSEADKSLYLAQFFIVPTYQRKGVGSYVLTKLFPQLHLDYKTYEVLTRHQNERCLLMLQKCGYTPGDEALVRKYEYDPLRYIGFRKEIY